MEDGMNKKLIERYYAAWNTLNTDNPAVFYAQDASLVFFDVVPFKYQGWAEYKKGVQKTFFDQISAGKLTPNDDLKITRRGNVAWMTLTFRLSFTLKTGAAMDIDCRHSAIWENRRGKWLIVHEHISAPLPANT
jgi:ketosteroid isomerase-like protein